jgi:hypothetical protein
MLCRRSTVFHISQTDSIQWLDCKPLAIGVYGLMFH